MKKRSVYFGVLSALLATAGLSFQTASAQDGDDEFLDEIVTTGTRAQGRVVADLAVAVDTLSADDMATTGQTEVGRMLQALAPSFNFSSSSISDGTDALRPATLRGLGPDQTLVLVNGKRRHQASLIHINNSVGRGTAGTDMNAIPAAAIKRIEVLRDGAAAQYGSDAIAGVINIQLKDYSSGGEFGVSGGEYTEGDRNSDFLGTFNSSVKCSLFMAVSQKLIIHPLTNSTLASKKTRDVSVIDLHVNCPPCILRPTQRHYVDQIGT